MGKSFTTSVCVFVRVCVRAVQCVWAALPFCISSILLLAALVPGCHKTDKALLDGGQRVKNNYEVYWEAKYFPLSVFVDKSMPDHVILGVYEAVEDWNTAAGIPVFVPILVDFMERLPEGCGWIAAVYKDIETDGLWRGVEKPGTSKLCAGEVILDYGVLVGHSAKLYTHELGHALGLAHDPGDKRSIMHPIVYSDYPQYIMPDDMVSVKEMVVGQFRPMKHSLKARIDRFLADL